jgi:allophanate hydrolase
MTGGRNGGSDALVGTEAPEARAEAVLARIDGSGRPEVWIHRVGRAELTAAFADVDGRRAGGADLPLAGLTFAVKDNIDVAGVPTTAGCPAFARVAGVTAPAVAALVEAGAVFVGKTNLDQFATGLVGTRSPYGAVRNAVDPERVSGGSSSGSAVAVALGLVDLALGTDTAGSGRVPAAFNGIVGIKPTRGMVSTTGVVPACASFDCVSVFATSLALARRVLAVMAGAAGPSDPRERRPPPDAPLGVPARPVVACATWEDLDDLDEHRARSYAAALARLSATGCEVMPVALGPFLEAGRLLYGGGFLAERHAAVGAWVDAHPDDVDPVVGPIITSAGCIGGSRLAADTEQLGILAHEAQTLLAAVGACSLVLPTAPFHPTIAEVALDPVGVNSRLGRYTTFVNLLDLCAVSVPAEPVEGLPFGVSFIGPAWTDVVQADLASRLSVPAATGRAMGDAPAPPVALPGLTALLLAVAGAHLSGQPLNHQLTDRGGRLVRTTTTAPSYRLVALDTEPPKPGLVRVADGPGAAIEVEVWELPPVGLASLLAQLPAPMALGPVVLADGSAVTGFLCEPAALEGALDITAHGGWRSHLASGGPTPD